MQHVMRHLTWLAAALIVVLAPAGLRAEDEPITLRRIELGHLVAPPAVRGAVLAAPSDLVLDERGGSSWSQTDLPEGGRTRQPWVDFLVPETQGSGPLVQGVEVLIEAVRWACGDAATDGTIDAQALALRLSGPAALVARLAEAVGWASAGVAPSVVLRATLTDGTEGRIVVQGSARLFAGRWTRVWLQEERPRFASEWEIEIAQATTAVRPLLRELPEGQELYARWLPGETLSLVELWSGDLEHQDVVEVDLTPVRNVPEASGLGPARAPRTALRRGYTVLAFRSARDAPQILSWDGPEGSRRLEVGLHDASPRPAVRPAFGEDTQQERAWLRSGAAAAGTLFESRSATTEQLLSDLHILARQHERGDEVAIDMQAQGTVLACTGGAAVREALVKHLGELEAALGQATLTLRVVTLPEESVRGAVRDGTLVVGAPPGPAAAQWIEGAGVVRGPAVRLPLVGGVKAGLRCGASVPGLVWLEVEVAQEAGGTDPTMGAAFAGLAGEVLLVRAPDGRDFVDAELSLSWADPKGGRVDLTFRPPVWMTQVAGRNPIETETPKRVTLPTLSRGGAEVAGRLVVGDESAPEQLLALVVRGSEALLVLGRAIRR